MTESLIYHGAQEASVIKLLQEANEHRDYSIYAPSMDAALFAKAESIFPHFQDVGEGFVIVDAGSGTGALAELAAEEFRGAKVYAVDISHELLERASDGRALTKLVFGDASKQIFPDNSVDIKYYSTSGHEIESFGGSMIDSLNSSFRELKSGGKIVIRDFAKPENTKPIYMQILSKVGLDHLSQASKNGYVDYNLLSTRALFLQFHKEFGGGNAFDYKIVNIDGKEYIKISPQWAHEFYLRKDYTGNWRQEIKEKYTYWTLSEAKENLLKAGFTDVEVIPELNDFIFTNRLDGKIALCDMDENGKLSQIPFPPTHMVVVGKKPKVHVVGRDLKTEDGFEADYKKLKESIVYTSEKHILTIGDKEFEISKEHEPIAGSKKTVYHLEGNPPRVIKVVRKDALNDHAVFRAIYQSVVREDILDKYQIPHVRVIEVDPKGPPYRYFIQEAISDNAICAAELIRQNNISKEDIAQMASYINTFELRKEWQLDTNPFNWYRVINEDGSSQMVYVDGKVYHYDENWEFKRIGLLQWIDTRYVTGMNVKTAIIPKANDFESFKEVWGKGESDIILLWKKYLHPSLQPS